MAELGIDNGKVSDTYTDSQRPTPDNRLDTRQPGKNTNNRQQHPKIKKPKISNR
jgi:hypothetical protein